MDRIISELQEIIDDLSDGRIGEIMRRRQNGVLTEEEISGAISDYSGTISREKVAEERLNLIEYENKPESGLLEYDLLVDGAASDLTLTCDYDLHRTPALKIESIHVL